MNVVAGCGSGAETGMAAGVPEAEVNSGGNEVRRGGGGGGGAGVRSGWNRLRER